MKTTLLLISLLLAFFNGPDLSKKGSVLIRVEGLKETSGNLSAMIFNKEEGFPDQKEHAYSWKEVKVVNNQPTIEFANLPPGKYAISLIHDVNSNKDLDRNMIGIPLEPFGFSNNKSILLGLPKFEDAAIDVKTEQVESVIKLIDLF